MNDIAQSIYSTIEQFIGMSKTFQFDRTIQGEIYSREQNKDNTWNYRILSSVTNSTFSIDRVKEKYEEGESVSVLIPEGDFNNDKIILAAAAVALDEKVEREKLRDKYLQITDEIVLISDTNPSEPDTNTDYAALDSSSTWHVDYNLPVKYKYIGVTFTTQGKELTEEEKSPEGPYKFQIILTNKYNNKATCTVSSDNIFGYPYWEEPQTHFLLFTLTNFALEDVTNIEVDCGQNTYIEETKNSKGTQLKYVSVSFGNDYSDYSSDIISIYQEGRSSQSNLSFEDFASGENTLKARVVANIDNKFKSFTPLEGVSWYRYSVGSYNTGAGTYWARIKDANYNLLLDKKTEHEAIWKDAVLDEEGDVIEEEIIKSFNFCPDGAEYENIRAKYKSLISNTLSYDDGFKSGYIKIENTSGYSYKLSSDGKTYNPERVTLTASTSPTGISSGYEWYINGTKVSDNSTNPFDKSVSEVFGDNVEVIIECCSKNDPVNIVSDVVKLIKVQDGQDGQDGKSVYRLNLSGDIFISILTDAEGNIKDNETLEYVITPQLYLGSEAVTEGFVFGFEQPEEGIYNIETTIEGKIKITIKPTNNNVNNKLTSPINIAIKAKIKEKPEDTDYKKLVDTEYIIIVPVAQGKDGDPGQDANPLVFTINDGGYKGRYTFYGFDNKAFSDTMLNSEKTLTAEYADSLGYGIQKIEWKIPKLNTLLKPVAASFNSLTTDNANYSASWNLEGSEYYIYTIEKKDGVEDGLILRDFTLPYQIKDLYLPTAINNNIECIVTTTENKTWEGKQEFYFSSGGNQGTQYGFGIGFKEGYPSALNRLYGVSQPLSFSALGYKYYIKNTYYLEDLNNPILLCDYGDGKGITNLLKYNESLSFENEAYQLNYKIDGIEQTASASIPENTISNLWPEGQTPEGWYTIVEAHLYDPKGKDITENLTKPIEWNLVYNKHQKSKKYGFTILTTGQIGETETDAHLSEIKNLVNNLKRNEVLIYSYSYQGLDGNILKATVNFPVTLTSMDGIAPTKEPAAADNNPSINFTAQIAIGSKQSSVKSLQAPTYISYDSMGKNPTYAADNLMLMDNDGNEEENIVWKLVQKDLLANPDGYFNELLIKEISGKYSLVPPSLYHDTPELIMLSANDTDGNEFWHQPIVITRNTYEFNLINNWGGELTIDEKSGAILSALIGSGLKNSENKFSGILLGAVGKENSKFGNTGLYGFKDGTATFGLKENGSFFFGPDADNQIRFDTNGDGLSIKTNKLVIDVYDSKVGLGKGKEFLIDTTATGSNPIMLYRATAGEIAKFVLRANGDAYIGGWNIESTGLYYDNYTYYFGQGYYEGKSDYTVLKATDNFKVTQSGKLYATGAEISGDIVADKFIAGREYEDKNKNVGKMIIGKPVEIFGEELSFYDKNLPVGICTEYKSTTSSYKIVVGADGIYGYQTDNNGQTYVGSIDWASLIIAWDNITA